MASGATRSHVLTVSVEEFFHHGAFSRSLQPKHWDRIESRLERNVADTLALLRSHDAKATFFVHGSTAQRQPEVVRAIRAAGHEVASRGFWARAAGTLRREELRDDLARTKEALESAGSGPVRGFRAARWLRESDAWILDLLADEGYRYDASVSPFGRRFASDRRFRVVHESKRGARGSTLHELPVSTVGLGGLRVPISGGNWWRQLPRPFVRSAIDRWTRVVDAPLVVYFMPWELDGEQPQLATTSRLDRVRHYRHLGRTRELLEELLPRLRFRAIEEVLALESAPAPTVAAANGAATRSPIRLESPRRDPAATPVTLVVPIFNELPTLAYLRRTLFDVRRELAPAYWLRLLLVDDGSTDGSREELPRLFGDVEDCEVVLHERNRGVAAAVMTGLRRATTDLVATIDADCTYDPSSLREMLPLAREADVVMASPYHPLGRVRNVPRWRLFLSKTLSRMYDRLLHDHICTYTSCFRVYRRSATDGLTLTEEGFPGMAELLVRMRARGARVVEYPTVLESRLLGFSKMRTVRTIGGHLRLLRRLLSERIVVSGSRT
jgi:polysaccharide deacetylase family protein (PEP-CTERM system associated)